MGIRARTNRSDRAYPQDKQRGTRRTTRKHGIQSLHLAYRIEVPLGQVMAKWSRVNLALSSTGRRMSFIKGEKNLAVLMHMGRRASEIGRLLVLRAHWARTSIGSSSVWLQRAHVTRGY